MFIRSKTFWVRKMIWRTRWNDRHLIPINN
jgi:hypothetical protein